MKKPERVMIIDALNLFLRSYIVNPTIAKDGSPIGGTVGFLKSLQKLTREIKPTRIVICCVVFRYVRPAILYFFTEIYIYMIM